MYVSRAKTRPRPMRGLLKHRNYRLAQSANRRRTNAIATAVNPTRSTACLSVSFATAPRVRAGMIVDEK